MTTAICVRSGAAGESEAITTDVSQTSTTAAAFSSITIPANTLRIGSTFYLRAIGALTGSHSSSARTVTYTLRYGGTTGTVIATTGAMAIPTGIAADNYLLLEGIFVVRTLGATGTAQGNLHALALGVTSAQKDYIVDAAATPVTIDTTTANALVLTAVGSGALVTHRGDLGIARMVRI